MIQKPDRHTLKNTVIFASGNAFDEDGNSNFFKLVYGQNTEGFSILTCECDHYIRKHWCKHIIAVYAGEYDDKKIPLEPSMMVDIFMKEPLLVPVVLSIVRDSDVEMTEVHVMWGDVRYTPEAFHAKGGEVIAYQPHPTRASVRKAILEWLPSKVYEVGKCTATSHLSGDCILDGLSSPENWDTWNEKSRRDFIRDIWCLLDEGRCVKCAETALVPF